MSDLQALFAAIEQLPPEELEQVHRFVESKQDIRPALEKDPELRLAALRDALDKFREGISDREMKLIAEAMNVKRGFLKDFSRFAWLDDLPEDER